MVNRNVGANLMNVTMTTDIDKLQKSLSQLERRVFKPAITSAVNKAGEKLKNESLSEVAKVQRVKLKLLKDRKRTTIKRAKFQNMTYSATMKTDAISWATLGVKSLKTRGGKGNGVRAGTGKTKHQHRHGFLGKTKTGQTHAFVRETNKRHPIRVLNVRLRVPFLRAIENRKPHATAMIKVNLNRELAHRTQKLIDKAAAK
jgi:hypothetical protein